MEKQYNDPILAQKCRDVTENLKEIRENIARAAEKSGRTAKDITLLAATKTVSPEVINHAIGEGLTHIGENKVQELCSKYDALHLEQCSCEFIGHLQTNKVKQLIGKVNRIQSVDSVKLAREISRLSAAAQITMPILVEVNVGGEENKSGISPSFLEELVEEIAQLPNIFVEGLMTIPPVCENAVETAQFFSNMYKYFIDIRAKKLDNVSMDYLSMGMSSDYELAIESGANIVRVGSSIFGKRVYA
jgi:hypothetical protein